MRTKTLLLTAAVTAAGILSSLAQSNVYSQNVVGYVNRALQGNSQYSLVSNPLSTTNNTYAGVLQSIPSGWTVLKWNGSSFTTANQSPALRVAFGNGWSPAAASTVTFNVGDAVFIKASAGAQPFTNTFVGDVLQGDLTNVFTPGYSIRGNIVPDAGPATNASWNFKPPTGNILLKWKEDGIGGYSSFTKTGFGAGWSTTVPSIDVAQGFFLNQNQGGTNYNWVRSFTVQ